MGMDCGGVTCIRANSSTRKSDLYSYLIDADMYFLPFHDVEVLWFNVNNDFLYLCASIGGFGGIVVNMHVMHHGIWWQNSSQP